MDRIAAVTDPEGNRTAFTYDKTGNQLSMTEADGAVWQYAYDKLNRVTAITNPLGHVESYEYDANGNIVTAADHNGVATAFTYDGNGNRISVTDGNGGVTSYEYDELNRIVKEISPEKAVKEYRYDALGNLTKYKDPEGLISEYRYDGLSNLTEEISPKGKVTAYSYDKHSNLVGKTDPKGNTTSYEVNLNDQVTKLTLPNEGSYQYRYDEAGRLKSIETPLGFQSSFQYDAADNIIKESNSLGQTADYSYDRLGRMVGSVDAEGGTSAFAYDIRGNVTSETDALGRTYAYSYDAVSQITSVKDPLGQETGLTYDPVGNLTQLTRPGGRNDGYEYDRNYNLTGHTDPMGNRTAYRYDADNRLVTEQDALKQKTLYQYDKAGRLTEETDKAGHTTGYAYDNHGNVMTVTDRMGYNTHFDYDDNDNLIKVTDAMGGITTYGYDAMDQLVSYTDASGSRTAYTYDLEGNLTSRTNPAGEKEQYAYDLSGKLTEYTAPSGKKIRYDYDKLNRLAEKSYETAKGKKAEEDVVYAYDAEGQRISMTDGIGTAAYEYDPLGRVTKAKDSAGQTLTYAYTDSGNIAEIGYPDGSSVAYEYDLNDNLIRVTGRTGEVTEYSYDALNRVTETRRPNGLAVEITYDPEGNITRLVTLCEECGEVLSTYSYTYNAQGLITEEKAKETLAGYVYDDKHNGKHKDGKHDSEYPHGNKHNGKHDKDGTGAVRIVTTERVYEYDENRQLVKCTETEENKGTTTYEYGYDKSGNRISYSRVTGGETAEKFSYEYDEANRLVEKTDKTDWKFWKHTSVTYEYDGDGNLISEMGEKESRTYEYTVENRLKAVSQGKEILMAALYDGDGVRLFTLDYVEDGKKSQKKQVLIPESEKTADGSSPAEQLAALVPKKNQECNYTITQYVNDTNREYAETLMERKTDGSVSAAYSYGRERLTRETAEGTSYYLYDGRGSVVGLAGAEGTITASYQYDPSGSLTFGAAVSINYYGYNGESSNVNTGLQYLRARYYRPENGGFLTEDTYPGEEEYPLTRNRYTYGLNNPVNYKDPSGHMVPLPSASGGRTSRAGTSRGAAAKGGSAALTKAASILKQNTGNSTKSVVNRYMSIIKNYSGARSLSGATHETSRVTTLAKKAAKVKETVRRELCENPWISAAADIGLAQYRFYYSFFGSMTTEQAIKLSKGIAEIGLGIGGVILGGGGTIGSGGGAAAVSVPLIVTSAGSIALGVTDVLDVLRNVQISQFSGGTGSSTGGTGHEKPTPEELAKKVPDKYKEKYKCQEFAESMEELMRKEGVEGYEVNIKSKYSDYIVSDKNGIITNNKIHRGIKIDGKIYDNLNPDGIPEEEWKHDLGIDEMPWAFEYDDKTFIH